MFRLIALILSSGLLIAVAQAAEPGSLLWEARPGGRDFGGLAEANGLLLTGNVTSTGGIFALNADSGKVLWQHRGEQLRGVITSDGQRAFAFFQNVGNGVLHLVAYSLKTGKLLWAVPGESKFGSDFATLVDGERLYLISQNGHVDAYNTGTGAPLWEFSYAPADPYCATGMVLADGRLIFGGGQNSNTAHGPSKFLWAIDPATGRELWRFHSTLVSADNDCYNTPALSGDTVVLTTQNFVLAVRASSGALLWTHKVEGVSGGYPKAYPLSPPVIVNGTVFAAHSEALSSWSLANGSPLPELAGRFDTNPLRTQLAGIDSTLFFLGDLPADAGKPGKHLLHAMDVQSRAILWTHRVNRESRFIEEWPTSQILVTPTAVYYENNSLVAKVSR